MNAIMSNRVEFSPGRFKSGPGDARIWEAAMTAVSYLLNEAELEGIYVLQPYAKVRWQGNHPYPIKVGLVDCHGVFLTVKPEGLGNDCVFEYTLRGRSVGWSGDATRERLMATVRTLREAAVIERAGRHGAEEPPELPLPAETPAPLPIAAPPSTTLPAMAGLSVVEKVQRLQSLAARNADRERERSALQAQQAAVHRQLAALHEELHGLEERELQLLEAIDNDAECKSAQAAIKALESLLD